MKCSQMVVGVFITLFLLPYTIRAQDYSETFKQGQWTANGGIGIISLLVADGSTPKSPLMYVAADYGVSSVLSVGGYIGHATNTISYTDIWGDDVSSKISHTIIGCRATFHYSSSGKFDPYLSTLLAYDAVSAKTTAGDPYTATSQLRFGLDLGTKYYLDDKYALFGEIGFGPSLMNLGFSIVINSLKHTDNEKK